MALGPKGGGPRDAAVRGVLGERIAADPGARPPPGAAVRLPARPRTVSAPHPQREDRDLLGGHRRLRLSRLPRAPGLARASRMARRPPQSLPPPAGGQPAPPAA